MLKTIINLWKETHANDLLKTFGADVQLFMNYFAAHHFENGDTGRNDAIDALCDYLKSQKTDAPQ